MPAISPVGPQQTHRGYSFSGKSQTSRKPDAHIVPTSGHRWPHPAAAGPRVLGLQQHQVCGTLGMAVLLLSLGQTRARPTSSLCPGGLQGPTSPESGAQFHEPF